MTEEKLNTELLNELIEKSYEDIKDLPKGSEERFREIENFKKLYNLSIDELQNTVNNYMQEQIHEDDVEFKREELKLQKKRLEFEKYKLKHVDINEVLKCATLTGNLMGGAMLEKADGILIQQPFKNLTNKIKL